MNPSADAGQRIEAPNSRFPTTKVVCRAAWELGVGSWELGVGGWEGWELTTRVSFGVGRLLKKRSLNEERRMMNEETAESPSWLRSSFCILQERHLSPTC
jgi:hypothetical protein